MLLGCCSTKVISGVHQQIHPGLHTSLLSLLDFLWVPPRIAATISATLLPRAPKPAGLPQSVLNEFSMSAQSVPRVPSECQDCPMSAQLVPNECQGCSMSAQ
eukprot:285629-Pelagomonas_calceolata.AAC.6